MNTSRLLASAALLLSALTASAQLFVGSDDFAFFDTSKWDYSYRNNGATAGNLSFGTGALDFSLPPGSGGNFNRLWNSDGTGAANVHVSSFTSDWTMTVQATNILNRPPGLTGGDFGAIGFQVFSDQGSYSALMLNVNSLGLAVRAESNGTGFTTTEVLIGQDTNVSLRLNWNATTQALGAAYSLDGTSFTSVATFLPTAQWNNTNFATAVGNGFNFGVFGNTNITTGVSIGSMSLDNFAVSAIPEPSTYAAFAGLGALGIAAWSRRRQAV